MEHNSLGCQVCLTTFNKMCDLKQHMRSRAHQEKMEEVFQKDKFKGSGFFPFIIVMDPLSKHEMKQPIIGLSLLTMCFSRETKTFFYLCHVCEEKRPPDKILHHLSSGDHCSNYFNYTNPNVLSFSWVPSMDMRVVLRPEITKEVKERGPGQLQMLDLPENLLKKLETSTYFEVMRALSENDKLLKLLEAVKPKRTMIQTYQRDRNRKHPLLGMQHLVECICVGPTEKRYYLCTLCNLTLATHAIIKHVLSFDHIFSYFKAWHPSTLVSKECYKDYTKQFASEILDFAKQTEEIHGTANTDMKQMSLEPGEFQSVNFACYAKALKELESITKEKKESSLITSVKPGKKLEFRIQSARPVASCYKLRCQDCSMNFKTISPYLLHLTKWNHKQMLKKFFGEAERVDGYDQTGTKPNLGLYRYLLESTKQNQPAIGVPLVVTCVNTEVQGEAIYVCFACEDCFPESLLRQHFNSRKHLIHTLLYQNPWRLPFAWENPLDVEVLRSMAWEEEKERGPNQMLLKVLDMPYWMFQRLIPPSYPKVMERLELYYTLLKREVPRRETYSKLKQSERFPLLGQQFLVMHVVCVRRHQSTEVGSLCLLCERRLSDDECYAHVFSREHVGKFLDRFHPGSQNSSTDAETLLDLAKQAACVHSISHVQVVKLDKPIWEPCSYHRAISILTSAKKRDRKGKLEPEIMPKQKLFPRETLKEVDKDHMRDNSQKNGRMMEGSVKNPSQKSTENTVKVGAEMTNTKCGENAEKGADEETPTPSEKESEKRREVFSKTSSEEIKNAGSDTCQAIKEEKIEEPTEIGEERRKDVPTQLKNNMYKENKRKRPSSMSEKSQEDTCPNEDVEKDMGHKRQRLTSKHDTSSCEEPQNLPSSGQKEATTSDKEESHKTAKDKASSNMNYQQAAQLWQYVKRKSREPVVGLSALLECHCDQCDPIYLCECCSLKIPEKDIVSHVTGFDHQKMYLGLQKLPTPPWNHQRMTIRQRALLLEKDEGYGEAQVVDVDEEIYNNISKQNFKSAIQTVKALQAQQESRLELPSTSALSAVQPVDTSVTLPAQYEVYSLTDDFQVVEIDDHSKDSEAQLSSLTATESVMTETTCKTTQVPPESADNTNTCLTVSRSSEDTSSLHVSTCGTNTTRLQPDSTEKAEIISNTTVGPLKIATTSKIVGTSQTAATSDSTVTTPTKSTTAVSKRTVESSNSTPDTTKSTAPISKLTVPSATTSTTKLTAANPNSSTTTTISTVPTYSCTTTTTNCRETAFKGVSSTSSVTETTSKFTATVSKLTGTTSTSSVNISGATSTTKSATVSKPLESRTGAAKMTKTSVKCENTEASPKTVHMKNSVGSNADVAPNIPKSKAPEAPHLMSVRSENRSPSTEPSHTSTSKIKPHESSPRVGLNMLIVVRCEGRQQIYCQLCSVKLLSSTHLRSYTHKYNYVKKMIPECTAKPSEFAKLDKMVALLAEVEKVAGSRSPETIEVKNDVYEELAALPEDKAVERLKEMVRQRDLRHSSSSTTNAAEVLRQQVAFASPCEVSSPDDGMYMPQNEMAGLSTDNQSEQENKHELQKLLVQMPEIESISEEDGNLAPGQSDKAQSFYGKSPQANDLISDQLHLCPTLINDPKPITTPIIQDADVAVKVEQETFEYDVESQATVDVTPAIESQVKMEKPQGWADPLATDSESTGRFAQTPDTCQETPEKGQQQERSDPELQDTQKVLEGTQKTSPVKIFNPDPLFSATSVNTDVQQNQSRPSQKTEHVPKHSGCSPGPWHHSASQALPIFSIGERTQGPSHLSSWLKVKGLETEPVIGLGTVWECRGIGLGSKFLNSFFLCESCSETLSTNDICQHMVSSDHQRKYMKRHYPEFLYWSKDDLDEDMKLEVLNGIAWMLSPREREIDAQCILLKRELYEYVRKAPFSEALNIVQEFEKEPKQRVFCLPICTPRQKDQQPEDRQSLEESLPTEMQSAQALETDQRSDNEARQKTEKHHLEENAMIGDLDGVKQRRVLSPLDVTSVSSKADSVVSPFPSAGTCLSPQETCRIISMQPELRPPVSQQQRPFPELQVKRAEVQSLSSSIVSPSQTLLMPPRDKCLPTRKRPAVTSVETLVRPCTNNPQLEDPLPAKYIRTCRSLQPIRQPSLESASEFTPVNPAATSILLSPKDEDTGPGFDKQDASIVDSTHIAHLIALLREMKSEKKVFPCMSAADNAETTTSCASPKSGVERRWDPKRVQTTSTMVKRRRWDSKCQLVKATVKKNLPPTNSLEGMVSTAAPVVLGYDSQLVNPNANSAFSANNSSLEGYLMRGNLLFRATETQAVGTMLSSASTADRSDPQHQGSVNAQSVFGNVSLFKPSPYFVASNPGQIPQPRCNSETGNTGVFQLPINTIITARPDPTNHQFMGGFKGQDHTKANRGNQLSHSVSTDLTASPSDTLAASGGFGQYSQMACVANGHSGYLSSETVAGYITPDNPPVYTGSLYQHEGYTKKGLYPSQIYPEQKANRFGHSLAMPSAGWVRLETQQQQQLAQQQQQQQLAQQQQQQTQQQQLAQQQQTQQQQLAQQQQQQTQQQQQLAQQKQPIQQQQQQQLTQQWQLTQQQLTLQQGSSWTSAALAAGNGKVNSEAACLGAVQFPIPANNSQRLIERMNDYSTNRIIPAQTSNNIITQNTPQVYLSPPVIHYSPTANSEFLAQASANSFYASGRGVFIVAPSMVNATPPVSHETTR